MRNWLLLPPRLGPRHVILFFIVLMGTIYFKGSNQVNIDQMYEVSKCPACYGMSLCTSLHYNGEPESGLVLNPWGPRGWLMNLVATKNVYTGKLNGEAVIVKRLGSSDELEELDKRVCRTVDQEPNCVHKMSSLTLHAFNLREAVRTLLAAPSSMAGPGSRLQLCPSTVHVDLLFKNIIPRKLGNDPVTANIWTTLLINPEPLLLQIMRADDGWPVPRYFGACGRIVAVEDAGTSLFDFQHMPWPVRAGLALQLLLAADRFTYSHPYFAFYLLDISPDNIAVSTQGKLMFIDLEHVIAVDRHPPLSEMPQTWNETHNSEALEDCPGCYTFSPEDMCSHHISDHNHFIICQQLLAPGLPASERLMADGLLHSIPSELDQQYPQMRNLLSKCAADHSTDRVSSARRLRDILHIASKESPLFRDLGLLETWKYSK